MNENTNKMKHQAGVSNSLYLYHRSYCQFPNAVRLLANTTSDPRGIFYSVPAIASKGPAGLDDQPFSPSPVSAAGDTYGPVAQLVEPPIVCSGECVGSSPARPILNILNRFHAANHPSMGLSRNLLPGLVVRDKLRPTRTGKN